MKIIDIYLSLEKEPANESEEYTDVVVTLENGEKYIASFFAYGSIASIVKRNLASDKNLAGRFFWSKHMILTSSCDFDTVKEVVEYLIEEGDFKNVFGLLNENITE